MQLEAASHSAPSKNEAIALINRLLGVFSRLVAFQPFGSSEV